MIIKNALQLWLLIGACLLALEFLIPFPTLFIAGALGVGALCVALIIFVFPLPFWLQVCFWLMTSGGFVWYSRRWMPKFVPAFKESSDGVTTTEILPGEAGRVRYEGVSWRAVCDDPTLSIGPQVRVHILRRQGTTLVVLPEKYTHEISIKNLENQE